MKQVLNANRMIEKERQDTLRIKQILENEMFVSRETNLSGKLFTERAVIVTVQGVRLIGENELRKFIQHASRSSVTKVLTKNEVIDVLFIRSDVAIVSAVQHIRVEGLNESADVGRGTITFVMVKEVGQWAIAAAQNTLVQKLPFEWKGSNQD